MSQWKFNDFEADIDFTDADFMEKFENAYADMKKNIDHTPKTGKVSERIRAQCEVFDMFFVNVFGKDSVKKMFQGGHSVEMRIAACNSLYEFRNSEDNRYRSMMNKYMPNRQQRRAQGKNMRKNGRR